MRDNDYGHKGQGSRVIMLKIRLISDNANGYKGQVLGVIRLKGSIY